MAAVLLTAASAVALPLMLYLALRLPGPGGPGQAGGAGRAVGLTVALAVAAAAIWLDPARATLGYGQVDIVLAAAVLYDLALPGTCRWKGAAIGLAAGIKITPAIFVAYLLLTRQYRAAVTAVGVFAGTVAAGFAVLPASSAWYWAGEFASPGRVDPPGSGEPEPAWRLVADTAHREHNAAVASAGGGSGGHRAGAGGRRQPQRR